MTSFKRFISNTAKALLMAVVFSAASCSAVWAEEETGPAFAPPVVKTQTPEIGPGIKKQSSNFVVVLDPGHGKTDGHYSGCSFEFNGVTYYEDEITMKIASYTKQYLEQFPEYTVYLTKDTAETTVPLEQRAAFAASVQADLFVSQHVDAAGAGGAAEASGVSALPPRAGRYNSELAAQSQEAAEMILNQLSALGISNRGLLMRDSQNGTLYPDGSPADYYAIPRYSQLYGIRGFIIEHGFLNNPNELVQFLSTEEQYRALGEADAKGIIEYLTKAGKASVTEQQTAPEGTGTGNEGANGNSETGVQEAPADSGNEGAAVPGIPPA